MRLKKQILILSLMICQSCSFVPKGTPTAYCGEIFVTSAQSAYIFDGASNGTVAPIRTLSVFGGGGLVDGVAIDTVNNEVYLTDYNANTISVFPRTGSGALVPLRQITSVANPSGIAVDPVHDEIFVTTSNPSHSIKVFNRTDTGSATPLRQIDSVGGYLLFPISIVVDTNHDELIVGCSDDSIQFFARTDNGTVPAARRITGGTTDISGLQQIAYNFRSEEVIVGSGLPGVLFFPRTATGNVAPSREITGSNTLLSSPNAISIDPAKNTIAVVDSGQIFTFDLNGSGDLPPNQIIQDASLSGSFQAAIVSCQ